jgi:hypothetical protein
MNPSLYYDRDANPISAEEWEALWFQGDDARRIARTEVGALDVSTVWLGIDHNWSDEGSPLIFETMIFSEEGATEDPQRRWSTREAAQAGHDRIVAALRHGVTPDEAIDA